MMRLLRPYLLVGIGTLAAAGGCDLLTGSEPRRPDQLLIVSGDGQEGTVRSELRVPLVARLVDQHGQGLEKWNVAFGVIAGGGYLSVLSAVTDETGTVQVSWTLGAVVADSQIVEARVKGEPPVTTRFVARALPGAPAQLKRIAGDGQEGEVGTVLERDLEVLVADAHGNPVEAVPVAWSVAAGGGTVSPRTSETDARGRATTKLRLGPIAGLNSVGVTAGEMPPVFFSLNGRAGPPSRLVPIRGMRQTGNVGSGLFDSLVVKIVDDHGNPKPGVLVRWSVASGGGSISPALGTTNENGLARAHWILGMQPSQPQVALASVGDLPPAEFTALGTTPGFATLAKMFDGQVGTVGRPLTEPITVVLRLPDGRPIAGAKVSWVVTSGRGRVAPNTSTTDSAGIASTLWTLGSVPGVQSATATVVGVTPATFTATAQSGEGARLLKVSGDEQSAKAGHLLPEWLMVRLVDQAGNPVTGRPVGWTIVEGDGTISTANASTDGDGLSAARVRLGLTVGSVSIEAKIDGIPAVTFRARATTAGDLSIVPSFDGQSASVGDTLPARIAVQVRYADGQPAAGVPVEFAVTFGGGSIEPSEPVSTDENGVARARWRLGSTPGLNVATATVVGYPSVHFSAFGVVPASSDLPWWSGDGSPHSGRRGSSAGAGSDGGTAAAPAARRR